MVIVSKANGGFVITTGSFTQEARTFAAGRQLQLIDGQTLRELLRDAEGQPTVMPTIIPTGIVDAPTLPR
jgi:restriction system protein